MPAARLDATYTLCCTFPGCGGERAVRLAQSCGLTVGMMLPETFGSVSQFGCPRCQRITTMRVTQAPSPPPPPGPKGFTKIPDQ